MLGLIETTTSSNFMAILRNIRHSSPVLNAIVYIDGAMVAREVIVRLRDSNSECIEDCSEDWSTDIVFWSQDDLEVQVVKN